MNDDNTENRCIDCAFLCIGKNTEINENSRRIIENLKPPLDPLVVNTVFTLKNLRCHKDLITHNLSDKPYDFIYKIIVQTGFSCHGWQRHHNFQSPKDADEIEQKRKRSHRENIIFYLKIIGGISAVIGIIYGIIKLIEVFSS